MLKPQCNCKFDRGSPIGPSLTWTETLQVRSNSFIANAQAHNFLQGTYTLIHSFLLKQSHLKVAQALKKAAKNVVILKDDVDPEGPSLDVILKEWKSYCANKTAHISCVKVISFAFSSVFNWMAVIATATRVRSRRSPITEFH